MLNLTHNKPNSLENLPPQFKGAENIDSMLTIKTYN